jgi:hypothetical protein
MGIGLTFMLIAVFSLCINNVKNEFLRSVITGFRFGLLVCGVCLFGKALFGGRVNSADFNMILAFAAGTWMFVRVHAFYFDSGMGNFIKWLLLFGGYLASLAIYVLGRRQYPVAEIGVMVVLTVLACIVCALECPIDRPRTSK